MMNFADFETKVKPHIMSKLQDKCIMGQMRDFLLFAKKTTNFSINDQMEGVIFVLSDKK